MMRGLAGTIVTFLFLVILSLFFFFHPVYGKNIKKDQKFKNYSKTGIASWFGAGLQGKRTASGERFDMNENVAAHRSLPFGTIAKIINLKSGKEVMVKIIDRGPNIKGRIIDLSYAAAKVLEMIRSGSALVKIEVVALP